MANKYIRHGATYCGDGTSPDLATSNGAPGAWNNINILEGTTPPYGTLAAGDVVYIRSKDESGAAITRTLTANVTLGSAAATAASPITWVVDDGSVWSGNDGALTWDSGASAVYTLTFRSYNIFLSSGSQRRYCHKSTSDRMTDGIIVIISTSAVVDGLYCDWAAKTSVTYNYTPRVGLNSYSELRRPKVSLGRLGNNASGGVYEMGLSHGSRLLIAPELEVFNTGGSQAMFRMLSSYITPLHIVGGSMYGAGVTSGQYLLSVDGATSSNALSPFVANGLSFPKTVEVINPTYNLQSSCAFISLLGMDGGLGAHFERDWGYVTSRTDNNPPTLSATFPDTALTPWSWRIWPRNTSLFNPAILDITTVWQGTDGIRTLTLDFLTEQTFSPGPTKGNTWLDVTYVDSTGVQRTETTLARLSTTPCEASSAAWSATSWGASVFSKYKITMTTAYAVKQNTAITVSFRTTLKAANSLQILFVDPEVKVS